MAAAAAVEWSSPAADLVFATVDETRVRCPAEFSWAMARYPSIRHILEASAKDELRPTHFYDDAFIPILLACYDYHESLVEGGDGDSHATTTTTTTFLLYDKERRRTRRKIAQKVAGWIPSTFQALVSGKRLEPAVHEGFLAPLDLVCEQANEDRVIFRHTKLPHRRWEVHFAGPGILRGMPRCRLVVCYDSPFLPGMRCLRVTAAGRRRADSPPPFDNKTVVKVLANYAPTEM